ncbi:MAG: hypothetical protein C0501_00575 [Isosphaera sp.]|nr:hypothetical protein [Isosphaera sp.]
MAKYLLLTPVLFVAACCVAPASFTVRNESGQPVEVLTVEVDGRTFRYQDVPAGGEVSEWFWFWREATLDVRGRYADGTEFGESCGYVVWEDFAPHVDVVVRPGGEVGERRFMPASAP